MKKIEYFWGKNTLNQYKNDINKINNNNIDNICNNCKEKFKDLCIFTIIY